MNAPGSHIPNTLESLWVMFESVYLVMFLATQKTHKLQEIYILILFLLCTIVFCVPCIFTSYCRGVQGLDCLSLHSLKEEAETSRSTDFCSQF